MWAIQGCKRRGWLPWMARAEGAMTRRLSVTVDVDPVSFF
jgi:hypothetical protein